MAVLMLVSAVGHAQTTYTMVTSTSGLEAGAQYILVGYDNDGGVFAMGYQKSNNRHALTVNETGGAITVTVATDPSSQVDPFEFTLDGSAGAWTIFDPLNNGYLCAPGGGNYLRTQANLDDKAKWTITEGENGGFVPVSNGGVEQCYMRYNITSTLFGCYKESSNVSAPVYFFKAGGPAQPDPEPTNYPTNFTASASGLDITVNWTDATGGQLPHKYVIVGAEEDIPFGIPVDGNPLPNGYLVANVNYGVQTAVFQGLEGGVNYRFAIFPYPNSGDNIDYKTDGDYPTAQATTEAMSSLFYEGFDNDLGEFTAINLVGEQEWHQASYQSTSYADMNGFASGSAYENDDWLISPEIQIPEGMAYQAINLEFRNAVKYDGNSLQVFVSTDYYGGAPGDANWTELTDAFDFSGGDFNWVESGKVNIMNELNGSMTFRVAFRYTSTDQAAAHWEIDWVEVTATETASVVEQAASVFDIYPNPANDVVRFTLDQQAQVSVYDLSGRMVSNHHMGAGANSLNVAQLENGVYFLNVRYTDGRTAVSRFVKF